MTTTDTNMSLAEIDRRIDLNKKSGWGLERGTQAQLNLLALYCQKHHLLPGDDVTLYEGKPWITIDGRVKLMRRNKDYRGHTLRPLTPADKQLWGYEKDDIVIEGSIYINGYPQPIQAHGRVAHAERMGQGEGRKNPVARTHPVEMATKRALSRAERMAFGTESYVDDDDLDEAVQTVIEERNDPVRRAAGAAKYVEVYGTDDDAKPEPERVTMRSPLGQRLAELLEEAARLEVEFDDCKVSFPAPREEVIRKGEKLRDRVEAKKAQLTNPPEREEAAALL